MNRAEFKVVEDSSYGFRRVDTIPADSEFAKLRESGSFRLRERTKNVAPGYDSFTAHERERVWLEQTLFSDIVTIIGQYAQGGHVLDVGCGDGAFVRFLQEHGFRTVGLEPDTEVVMREESRDLPIYPYGLDRFIHRYGKVLQGQFDAVSFLNVLEYAPDPSHTLLVARSLMRSQGLVCVRVPNYGNELRLPDDATDVNTPINFFTFESLEKLLECTGFEVVHQSTDFPTDLIRLAFGTTMAEEDEKTWCEERRAELELALPAATRMKLAAALASANLGDNCLVFARKTS